MSIHDLADYNRVEELRQLLERNPNTNLNEQDQVWFFCRIRNTKTDKMFLTDWRDTVVLGM